MEKEFNAEMQINSEEVKTLTQPCTTGESSDSNTGSSHVQQPSQETDVNEELENINSKISELEKERKKIKLTLKQCKKNSLQSIQGEAKKWECKNIEYRLVGGATVTKKLACIKYNRKIQWKRVLEFTNLIRTNKYYDVYPIIVSHAEDFHKAHPEVKICGVFGTEIQDKDLADYFILLDGQHRALAHIVLMSEIKTPIPGVVVKDNITDVAEFLQAINPSGSWSNIQKMEVCALTSSSKYRKLCLAIRKLCDKGFNRSTASEIYIGRPITSKQVDALLSGQEPKNEIAFNIGRGDAFIEACTNAGIETKFLTKRYFIEGFMDFQTEKGEKVAMDALKALPHLDIDVLKSIKSKGDFKEKLAEQNINKTI